MPPTSSPLLSACLFLHPFSAFQLPRVARNCPVSLSRLQNPSRRCLAASSFAVGCCRGPLPPSRAPDLLRPCVPLPSERIANCIHLRAQRCRIPGTTSSFSTTCLNSSRRTALLTKMRD
ncbi:hypothetical protein MPTK1_2g12470 [Marchantia polymorpha subsp. ruderalis]